MESLHRRWNRILTTFGYVVLLCVATNARVAAQETLSNEDVVALVSAGVEDAIIIGQIEASSSSFDLSTKAIVALSEGNVSAPVIAAMRESRNRFGKPKQTRAAVELPSDFGAYLVREGEVVRLPGHSLGEYTEKNRSGKQVRRLEVEDVALASDQMTLEDTPTIIVFLRDPANAASVKLVSLYWLGDGLPADLEEVVPTRQGMVEGSKDSRYVRITPSAPLPVGVYAILSTESRGLAHPFVHAAGSTSIRRFDDDLAQTAEQLASTEEVVVAVPPDVAMKLVRDLLRDDDFTILKDFDADGLLVSDLRHKKCGLFSLCTKDKLVQFAVSASERADGTALRLDALVYESGLPGGEVFEAGLDATPMVEDSEDRAKQIESLRKDIQKAVEKHLKK